ncbi:hypothetical protein FOCC_FOCC014124 [Frankliniella occidentalis]|nr:hypothetical protein FOCC_FOCC014124 [Frankliniella occidentalis]
MEAWYRQQVLMYVPWHHDEKTLVDAGSWKELYEKYEGNILKFGQVLDIGVIQCDPEYEESDNVCDTIRTVEEFMIASSMTPAFVGESVDLGDREIDLMHDWNANCLDGCSVSTAIDFPKRVIVQGKAGTGKSLVIHAIQAMLKNSLGEGSVMLVAPTGVAAVNIGGATIHSTFHINLKEFNELRGSSARKFSNEMEKVKFLIVDEYSMIGLSVLGMMERRCREGKGTEDFFGGLFVFLFGDINQLNPVLDTALYDKPKPYVELALHGKAAFESFDGSIVLTSVMRQRDSKLKSVLDNVGCGQVTSEDYEYLKSRFVSNVSIEEKDMFKDSIRLFPKKDSVAETNLKILSSVRNSVTNDPIPIARIRGRHNCSQAAIVRSEDADGLEPVLYLGKGAKVMLRKNLWTEMGLVNGSIGQVVDFVFEDGKSYPHDSCSVILCKFPQYKGPTMEISGVSGIVPISMYTKSWVSKNGKCLSRAQFPLVLAYACSIHKSQGLTLQRVIVDIGALKEQCVGLSYVALSRCTSLEGMLLVPFSLSRFLKINTSSALKARQLAEKEIFSKKIM